MYGRIQTDALKPRSKLPKRGHLCMPWASKGHGYHGLSGKTTNALRHIVVDREPAPSRMHKINALGTKEPTV